MAVIDSQLYSLCRVPTEAAQPGEKSTADMGRIPEDFESGRPDVSTSEEHST